MATKKTDTAGAASEQKTSQTDEAAARREPDNQGAQTDEQAAQTEHGAPNV